VVTIVLLLKWGGYPPRGRVGVGGSGLLRYVSDGEMPRPFLSLKLVFEAFLD